MAAATLVVEVGDLVENYDPELIRERVEDAMEAEFRYHAVEVEVLDE